MSKSVSLLRLVPIIYATCMRQLEGFGLDANELYFPNCGREIGVARSVSPTMRNGFKACIVELKSKRGLCIFENRRLSSPYRIL